MRSVHSRYAFAALDNLIDRHYLITMSTEKSSMSMTLAQHLANLNAEKRAWVAEDPDNRWAGMYVEDLAHWAEYGVFTVAQFKRYENESMFWDMYKDVYGYRPRHVNLKDMSDEELEKQIDYLGSEMERAIQEQEEFLREIEEEEARWKAEKAAKRAEMPEKIDYVACKYQEGWL